VHGVPLHHAAEGAADRDQAGELVCLVARHQFEKQLVGAALPSQLQHLARQPLLKPPQGVRGLAWLQPPAAACVTRDLRAPGSDGSREAELRAWLWPRLHEQLSRGCPSAAGTRRNSAVL